MQVKELSAQYTQIYVVYILYRVQLLTVWLLCLSQTKQHLLECFDMLIKSLDVWGRDEKQSRNVEDVNCLKENVLLTAHAFIHISLGQYEGYVCLQSKQVQLVMILVC